MEDALRTLQMTDHIEGLAMQVQILIMMERVDLGMLLPKVAFFLDYTKLRDHIAPPFLIVSTNVFLQQIGK